MCSNVVPGPEQVCAHRSTAYGHARRSAGRDPRRVQRCQLPTEVMHESGSNANAGQTSVYAHHSACICSHPFIFPVPEQASVPPAHTQLHPSTPQEAVPPRFHFKPPSKPCMQYAPRPLSHHSDSQHIEPLVRKPEWPFPTPNVTARQASVLT